MTIFEFSLFWFTVAPTYYGTAYALWFVLGYLILKRRARISENRLDDLLFFVFLGVFFWGRLGYVLFYDLGYFLENPLEIPKTWKGWMSFHGGVIGVVLAMWAYSKKFGESFLKTADEVTLILPIGIMLGRIANYANGELFGYSPYSGPFAMVAADGTSRFPSPLLEALLEWPLLFAFLFAVSVRTKISGIVATSFLYWYAVLRIFAEFFRTPDAQVGYLFGWLTLWQTLSFAMLIASAFLYKRFLHDQKKR